MPEAQPPQQTSTIVWLLQSGDHAALVLGLTLSLVGIVLVRRPNRKASIVLAFLSLLPGIVGLFAVYSAASDYSDLAVSQRAPEPLEFLEITRRAMGSSFCGVIGTLIPIFIAVLALSRSYKDQ